jgi:hypothetical protein
MAIFIWITKPLPDAVLFAHNRHLTLFVASANGHVVGYGRLSDFFDENGGLSARAGKRAWGVSNLRCDVPSPATLRSVYCHCNEKARSICRL